MEKSADPYRGPSPSVDNRNDDNDDDDDKDDTLGYRVRWRSLLTLMVLAVIICRQH